MDHESLISVIERMIAAGGVRCLPARTSWPLHVALRELYEEAGRLGLRSALGLDAQFEPSPEVGQCMRGADAAFRSLIRRGLLTETGVMGRAHLQVDRTILAQSRRMLMRTDPAVVGLIQRAGERWAALASTVAKYDANEPESFVEIVASGVA